MRKLHEGWFAIGYATEYATEYATSMRLSMQLQSASKASPGQICDEFLPRGPGWGPPYPEPEKAIFHYFLLM